MTLNQGGGEFELIVEYYEKIKKARGGIYSKWQT
jgi:hypothetical protein